MWLKIWRRGTLGLVTDNLWLINLRGKHDLICHVAKVEATTSAHSMVDVILFFSVFSVFIILIESNASIKPKKISLTHSKENNIRNIFHVLMFQQLSANRHHTLRHSKFGRAVVLIWSPTKKIKPRVKHEPRPAHGHAVKKISQPICIRNVSFFAVRFSQICSTILT